MRQSGRGDFKRADRVASEIREVMALIVYRHAKDPRLSRATITRVTMSSDLRNATVYFTVFPGEEPELYQEVFDRTRGALRMELARRIRLKYVPGLVFLYDTDGSPEDRIDQILRNPPESGDWT